MHETPVRALPDWSAWELEMRLWEIMGRDRPVTELAGHVEHARTVVGATAGEVLAILARHAAGHRPVAG